jgi:L-lactate dehydrogenase complex protein LldG
MSLSDSQRARREIFARLGEAMPPNAMPVPDVGAYYARRATNDTTQPQPIVERFIERARGWQAEVIETSMTSWSATLGELAERKALRHVLAGRKTWIAEGIADALPSTDLHWYDESIDSFKTTLFTDIDAGITTTRGGIAETGSLILWPTIDEPRTLSLVPPIHIAVLRASELHETLHEAMRAQAWSDDLPTNALLATGPSKTADIQRLLVYGAHGPKQLVILLIRDEVSA